MPDVSRSWGVDARFIAGVSYVSGNGAAMTPIPLTAPNGTLYGYACGVCHHMRAGAETLGYPDGPVPSIVAASLREATECCTCYCGGALTLEGECERCGPSEPIDAATMLADLEAERAAERADTRILAVARRLMAEPIPATVFSQETLQRWQRE